MQIIFFEFIVLLMQFFESFLSYIVLLKDLKTDSPLPQLYSNKHIPMG
jgi:hypothetical protein